MAEDKEKEQVKIWFNADGYRLLSVSRSTTCEQVFIEIANELGIPERLAKHFHIHARIDGKEHLRLVETDSPLDIQHKIKQEGHWREEGYKNGFVFFLKDESVLDFLNKSGEILPQKKANEEGSSPSTLTTLRSLLQINSNKRKGIGHQRSKSGPAISTPTTSTTTTTTTTTTTITSSAEATTSTITPPTNTTPTPLHTPPASIVLPTKEDTVYKPSHSPTSSSTPASPWTAASAKPRLSNTPPQSPTTATRTGSPAPEKAAHRSPTPTPTREPNPDEQEALILKSTAPHLEPRLSSSPPRASIRARSKTIAGGPSPLLKPGLRSSLKLSGAVEVPKGKSGHAYKGSSGSLPTVTVVADEAVLTTVNANTNGASPLNTPPNTPPAKRSASPPPPPRSYRFTPPPAMLAPVTASPGTLRARAQTTAPKQVTKWVSVTATKPQASPTRTTSESDLRELVGILDKLSTHKTANPEQL